MRVRTEFVALVLSLIGGVAMAQSDGQKLDAAVKAAISGGDFRRAKELALTPTHWQWIEAASETNSKLGGLSIGMSTDEVRRSKWGQPLTIIRTTNSGGEHEQWVYDRDRFLFFINGKLRTVTN